MIDPTSDTAREAAEWTAADPEHRGRCLQDLLELADALPPNPQPPATPFPEKVVAIHDALARAGVPHAIGGAIAVAYYGVPRTTVDIDLNAFVPQERWLTVSEALSPLGIDVELDGIAARKGGRAEFQWEENPIDVFFSWDDLHEEMPRRLRFVPFAETTIPIPAPEHLIVRKAILNRPKDWLDIEQILVVMNPPDVEEIDAWLRRTTGKVDSRTQKLQKLHDQLTSSPER
jgi:hypothetical protein